MRSIRSSPTLYIVMWWLHDQQSNVVTGLLAINHEICSSKLFDKTTFRQCAQSTKCHFDKVTFRRNSSLDEVSFEEVSRPGLNILLVIWQQWHHYSYAHGFLCKNLGITNVFLPGAEEAVWTLGLGQKQTTVVFSSLATLIYHSIVNMLLHILGLKEC